MKTVFSLAFAALAVLALPSCMNTRNSSTTASGAAMATQDAGQTAATAAN